ncbi:MAG: YceI family protein [Flavobacterium sp.]|uniref:YceI family protein n=1 Tax=Flavobacterium sp. TaxID=239 RepID=UPI003267DC14
MKKTIILVLFFIIGNTVFSQKMMTRVGEIKFEASMPALEEIAGTNKTASCIFDETTGDFVALSLVKAFKFKSPLMEEHFNENYMESSKFPKATFKGKILNFDEKKLSTTKIVYDLEGDLTIHGVTKKIKTKINLVLVGGKVNAITNFSVNPQDYNIEIPNLVKDKIAKDVKLTVNFLLETK